MTDRRPASSLGIDPRLSSFPQKKPIPQPLDFLGLVEQNNGRRDGVENHQIIRSHAGAIWQHGEDMVIDAREDF